MQQPALKTLLYSLGSLRLALVAMLALAITALCTYKNPAISINWVVLPLSLLGTNLLAAILTNQRFRSQAGLMLFHLGLLAIIVLAAMGLMTSFEARLEITEGQAFDPADVEIMHRGLWHSGHLDRVKFIQGPVQVSYVSAQRRTGTRSQIRIADAAGQLQPRTIGDRQILDAEGYRFITTSNKGYSMILTWLGDDGTVTSGAVHMPSYPLLAWKQDNEWSTPQGQQLSLSLQLADADRAETDSAWTLDSENVNAQLLVKTSGQEQLLAPSGTIRLERGSLRFEEVRMWMGYRIDYNPMLIWQFMAALFAVVGLGFHFWQKFSCSPLVQSPQTRPLLQASQEEQAGQQEKPQRSLYA